MSAPTDERRGVHPEGGHLLPIGRRFPKGVSGNPNGRPKNHKTVLRELIGEHGQQAYSLIWKIAQGELTFEKLAREPGPGEDVSSAALIPLVRVAPSIRERLDAATFLAEQLNGKATATLDVHAKVENETRFDLGKIPDATLAEIERGLALAAAAGEVVDAEFSIEAPGLLPEGWTEGEQGTRMSDVVECASVFPVDCETASASDYLWEV